MEQDKLPCTPPDSPDSPCDREVFEGLAAGHAGGSARLPLRAG